MKRFGQFWKVAIAAALLAIFLSQVGGIAIAQLPSQVNGDRLPPLKTHSLPSTLTQWHDPTQSGDYFSQVEPTEVGYLIWSEFPVKVYLELPDTASTSSQAWVKAVLAALQEWQPYFPLEVVDRAELADITIWRKRPPLRLSPSGEILRARSAETQYELYARQPASLRHRCQIYLSPSQTFDYTLATARHELGHALGIWGHSPSPTDVMYFSQVRDPAAISPRDINTLKLIYQQPTRLG